jgi:hypothetical protein
VLDDFADVQEERLSATHQEDVALMGTNTRTKTRNCQTTKYVLQERFSEDIK